MSWRELIWGWRGRINRLQFFIGSYAITIVIALAALGVASLLMPSADFTQLYFATGVYCQATSAPFLASLLVRRLHDVGRGAIVLLIPASLLAVGELASAAWPGLRETPVAALIGGPVALMLIWLIFALGHREANRFGPPPEPGLPKRW